MALKIDRGLFNSEFTDHHAVLGVSVEASPKDIRKRYLKIARRLHPDSSSLKNEAERQLANELLSKLVNPAYEKLTQEKEQAEYNLILKLKGKQANQQQETVLLTTEAAGKLASTNNYTSVYSSTLQKLSEQQYDRLDNTLDIIGQISELNLVYLMKLAQTGGGPTTPPKPPIVVPDNKNDEQDNQANKEKDKKSKDNQGNTGGDPDRNRREKILKSYLDRASKHESLGNLVEAVRELREALKFEPKSSECHSRLGALYMKIKQPKMAKIHFNQALKLDPNNEIAKAGARRLDPNAKVTSMKRPASGKKSSDKGNNKSGGGLFGLFGGKKK